MEPVTIKKYMSYLGNHKYPALFSDEVIKRLKNIEEVYGDVPRISRTLASHVLRKLLLNWNTN